jgi:16S rRNA (uracil1498-N3)-methyltransferase
MNLFYANPEDIYLPEVLIRGQEAKHISKVLRYKEGDLLDITDGKGRKFSCKITRIEKDRVAAEVLENQSEERHLPWVTLCVGIIKKRDRLEFAVEKAVELGVDEIVVFRGEHSQKQNVRIERLKDAALSAMKQSLRFYLPEVRVESSIKKALNSMDENTLVIVADETAGEDDSFQKLASEREKFTLIVGPEGGFSKKEREEMNQRGVVSYSLGKKRLRTETAALLMVDRFKNR